MAIEVTFHNWQTHQPEDDARYDRCSPNLVALGTDLGKRFQMTNNGCYIERDIRSGSSPSSHSHGAATDRNWPDRLIAVSKILPFLIDNSRELHVQAIHDYFGCRIWRAGRTSNIGEAHTLWWRKQTPSSSGMGQSWARWFHIETTESGWADSRPITDRLGGVVLPPPDPTPVPPGGISVVFTRTIKPGDSGPDVGFVQTVLRAPGSPTGNKLIIVDGKYGPQSVQAVKNVQAFTGLVADGIIGPRTQAKFMELANS
jgi:hypothetical protein